MPRLVVLTGASGSGKTTLAKALAAQREPGLEVLFFDSIGVPSADQMISEFGSGEAWQRAKTIDWMKRIADIMRTGTSVVLEGQMRIGFIEEAVASAGISDARIILVDCNDDVRARRLRADRAQPELANPTMTEWARFLRDEAQRRGHEILDTSEVAPDACTARIRRYM
jgi:adenylate kinase family enzyme